jgi:hypothetical protein
MNVITDYVEFDDGDVLLRRTTTSTKAGFRLMSTGTNGQWRDDMRLGLNTHEADCRSITVAEAAKIAARLGGSLFDDGGIVPVGKNGPE